MEKPAAPDALNRAVAGAAHMAAMLAGFTGKVPVVNPLWQKLTTATEPTAAMLIFPHLFTAAAAAPTPAILPLLL